MTSSVVNWPIVELGQHVDLLTGYPFKSKEFSDQPDDVRLLRGDNVAQGSLRWENAKRWDANQYEDFKNFHLQEGDVILAMDRPWITAGLKFGWITERDLPVLLVQRVARMRGDNGLETTYLRYLVASPDFTDHVLSIITGVNVPHISGRDIKSFKFRLPPLLSQQRIASLLSAYDDLIENNTRRIAILEEMGRRLYEEWFVHFRFPGHEGAGFKESELGKIPEGWEVQKLGNVAQINPEAIKPKSAPDAIHYIDIASVSPGKIDKAEAMQFPDAPSRARRIVRSGDVLWSCVRPNRRSCAMVIEPKQDTVASTGFAVLRAVSISKHYLYQYVRADLFVSYLANRATGAAYPAVKASDFNEAKIIVPHGAALSDFDEAVAPMRSMIHRLERKNINRRAQRDLLLPKLVSGEIDVSDIPRPEEASIEAA